MKSLPLFIFCIVACTQSASAFVCHSEKNGVKTKILSADWNARKDALLDLTILEKGRSNMLFRDSLFEDSEYSGVYHFKNKIIGGWAVDKAKKPSWWERVFGDPDTVDPYFGNVPRMVYSLSEHTEFRWHSVHLIVDKEMMHEPRFKARFGVTFHGRLNNEEEEAKYRNPINDQLICFQ